MKLIPLFKENRRPAMEPTMSAKEIAAELGVRSVGGSIAAYGKMKPTLRTHGHRAHTNTFYARSEAKQFIDWYRSNHQ